MALLDSLIAKFQADQAAARAANERRYQQGLEIFDRIISRYQPEKSEFLKATEAQLERGRKAAVSQGMQSLVSAGLAGTTEAAGLAKRYEEEVAAPARLQAQDIVQQRLTEAELAKAAFIERREDIGPDYAAIASLVQAAASAPRPRTISYAAPTSGRTYTRRFPTFATAPAPTSTTTRRSPSKEALARERKEYASAQWERTLQEAAERSRQIREQYARPTTDLLSLGQGPITQEYAQKQQTSILKSINPYLNPFAI